MTYGTNIIAVDFDGTIVDRVYPDPELNPVPYAIEWLKKFQSLDVKIILSTLRSKKHLNYETNEMEDRLTPAIDFLKSHDIHIFAANKLPGQKDWTSSTKIAADVIIDDTSVGCPLIHPPGFKNPCVDWKIVGPETLTRLFHYDSITTKF